MRPDHYGGLLALGRNEALHGRLSTAPLQGQKNSARLTRGVLMQRDAVNSSFNSLDRVVRTMLTLLCA